MRAVVHTEEGILELNWMWLPTWIGMNANLKASIEKELAEKVVGLSITEDNLDYIHGLVVDYLVKQNTFVEGLRDYLDSLKFVQYKPHG